MYLDKDEFFGGEKETKKKEVKTSKHEMEQLDKSGCGMNKTRKDMMEGFGGELDVRYRGQ